MNVKIDTKEIFYVISILDNELTANMAADLKTIITEKQEQNAKSLILDFSMVNLIDNQFVLDLVQLSENLYKVGKSFVICNLQEGAKHQLETLDVYDRLNITPTESEAWDIVQMEEIERELGTEFPE